MTDDSTRADRDFMRRALALAERGWGQTAPNPMVGAVVVSEGVLVGEGFHAAFGEAHAEVVALAQAAERARGATLYATLEPCAHHGKTPPCADAIIAAGVARVVAAVADPTAVARGGAARLRAAGVAVEPGTARECQAAVELNAPFFHGQESARPWVTLKLAVSADGAIVDPSGEHRWITGAASRAEVHRLRANSDAIAVGVGTVFTDDPQLTVRDAPPPRIPPRRVVFDSHARLPLEATLVRTAPEIPTIVVASPRAEAAAVDALAARGIEVLRVTDAGAALEALGARGVRSLLVEGGARLAGSLLAGDLVDRLIIFRSGLVVGQALGAFDFAPPGFAERLAGVRVVDQREFDDDTMITYALHELACSPV